MHVDLNAYKETINKQQESLNVSFPVRIIKPNFPIS